MYEYEFRFSANLAKVVAAVGTLIDSLNESMHSFGFPEKLVIRRVTTYMTHRTS